MTNIHRHISIIILMIWATVSYSQTVSFDCEVNDMSYGAISDYGDWYSNNALAGSGKQHSGNKAIRFRNTVGAYLVYEGADGNGKDGGIGDVTFYYRHWDGDGHTVKFKCQYSTDGGTNWIDIGSEVTVTATSYTQYSETVNVGGDDILFRILSTAYQERCLIDDIVITGHGGGGGPSGFTMSDDGSITEENENGEILTITLNNDTFVNPLTPANWSIINQPAGVSIGSISRTNDTVATLTLSGNRTQDYDSDITNFTLTIDNQELQNLNNGTLSSSDGITFTANNDVEELILSDDGNITEGSEDGETITINIRGGTFATSLNTANWTLSNAPAGVSIGSLTRSNDTTASITLSGNNTTDYDSDITNTEISIDEDEINDYSGANITKNSGITFTAIIEPKPTIQSKDIVFNSIGSTEMDISWTRGDGENCLIIMRIDNAVDTFPVDASTYSADANYGDGHNFGNGNYVVYNGNSNSVNITGLTSGKEYHLRIFEYNNQNTNTKYDTSSSTDNPISEFTKPNPVSDFKVECISKNTAHITWTPPNGAYDGIIIAMRQSTNSVHVISGGGSTHSANSNFGDGDSFGSTSPNSYYVYNGTGNSVNITGLTSGSSYTFKAQVYKNSLWSNARTVSAKKAEIDTVTNLQHYAPSQEIVINWDNPSFNCPDEVMVVARKSTAITTTPSGDGSNYTANSAFGSGTDIGSNEYVVYKGTSDGVTITGLTNDTTYHFSIFIRDNTSWSEPVSADDTPDDISIFFQGDLAILAINTDIGSSKDEISLVCFDTLKTGSSIDITDNGWERSYPDKWGSTEGVIRFTRNGPDVLPGEVFTFTGKGHIAANFSASGLTDNSWTVSSLNGNRDFNLNSSDQIWIMQYGSWSNGSSNHKSTYSGNILYGWTATGWAGDAGHGSHGTTSYSALYPFGSCFNTNVTGTANKDKVKYTGPTTATTQREWISRIKEDTNWTGYSDNTNYDGNGPDYTSGVSFTIIQSSYSDGDWLGSIDSNWFNCGNWAGLKVPDENTNVTIDNSAKQECVISATAEFSDDFNDTAECKNLVISDSSLHLTTTNDVLKIHNDIEINGGEIIPLAGTIIINRNWKNNSATAFQKGTSNIIFSGNTLQTINNTIGEENFYTLEINNSNNNIELLGICNINHLKFTDGKISLNNNNLIITDSVTGYSASKYIITNDDKAATGFLFLNVGTTAKTFPIGTANSYTPATLTLNSGSGIFKARAFSNIFENGTSGNQLNDDQVNTTWHIEPKVSGSYTATIKLQWNLSDESTNFGTNHSSAAMLRNANTGNSTGWNDWSILNNSGSVNGLNPYSIQSTNNTNFGSFGVGVRCVINKPQTSNIYHF